VPNNEYQPIGYAVLGEPLSGELCSVIEEPDPGEFEGCDYPATSLDSDTGMPLCTRHSWHMDPWWEEWRG